MRRNARDLAFKIIFESLFNEKPFNEEIISELKEKDKPFFLDLFQNYENNKKFIQDNVKKHLIGFNLDRVYKIDLALLYLAVTEIEFIKTPEAIVVNEVLEISKVYSTEKSPKFLNGVLSSYIKDKKD